MFDVPRALKIVNELQGYVQEVRDTMPQMMPLVQEVLKPLMNGHQEQPMQGKPRKHISEATRAKMRAAAAKRWGKKSHRKPA